jgi:hypothetical protein
MGTRKRGPARFSPHLIPVFLIALYSYRSTFPSSRAKDRYPGWDAKVPTLTLKHLVLRLPMKVSLVIGNGKLVGKVIPVTRKQFVIGRHRKCQLCVNSNRVSVHHCAVLVRGESAWVRDFDSTNGTYVNDEIIKGDRQLRHLDVLRIGALVLEVHFEAGQTEKKVHDSSEKAAAKVMHENSWCDIGDGVLSPSPASHYGVTDLKIPPVTDNDLPRSKAKRNT